MGPRAVDEGTVAANQQAISKIHGIGLKALTAQWEKPKGDALASSLDLLVFNGVFPVKNKDYSTIQKYHQAGHKVYLYNYPQVGEERPETYRRHYGLILWQAGADGVMNYAYQDGFGFIYNDFDFSKYKDHVFAYPTVDGVIGTLQWEGFREGVDDMRYLSTLLAEIKSAKAKGRNTSAAETYLASLKQSNLATVDLDTVRGELASWIGKVKAL